MALMIFVPWGYFVQFRIPVPHYSGHTKVNWLQKIILVQYLYIISVVNSTVSTKFEGNEDRITSPLKAISHSWDGIIKPMWSNHYAINIQRLNAVKNCFVNFKRNTSWKTLVTSGKEMHCGLCLSFAIKWLHINWKVDHTFGNFYWGGATVGKQGEK